MRSGSFSRAICCVVACIRATERSAAKSSRECRFASAPLARVSFWRPSWNIDTTTTAAPAAAVKPTMRPVSCLPIVIRCLRSARLQLGNFEADHNRPDCLAAVQYGHANLDLQLAGGLVRLRGPNPHRAGHGLPVLIFIGVRPGGRLGEKRDLGSVGARDKALGDFGRLLRLELLPDGVLGKRSHEGVEQGK